MLKIKYFGMVAEAVGTNEEELEFAHTTIQDLNDLLNNKYSKLKTINFQYAVNQSIVENSVELNDNDEIALLPPFAGG